MNRCGPASGHALDVSDNAVVAPEVAVETVRLQHSSDYGGRAGPAMTALRVQNGRTESSLNVWQNWGYLAKPRLRGIG